MDDARWIVSAGLTIVFFIAAMVASGALAIGWLLLSAGMAAVTVIRYRSARTGSSAD